MSEPTSEPTTEELAGQIIDRLAQHPEKYIRATALAMIVDNEYMNPHLRAAAQAHLEQLIDSVSPPKPEYRWVQGAKVRVR